MLFFNQTNRLLICSTLLATLIVPMFCSVMMMRRLEKETDIEMTVEKILAISRCAEHPNELHLERKVLIHLTIVQHLKMLTLIRHLASHDAPEGSPIAQSLQFLTRRLDVQIVADPEMVHQLPYFLGKFIGTGNPAEEDGQTAASSSFIMPNVHHHHHHHELPTGQDVEQQNSESDPSHMSNHVEICQPMRLLLDRLRLAHAQQEEKKKEEEEKEEAEEEEEHKKREDQIHHNKVDGNEEHEQTSPSIIESAVNADKPQQQHKQEEQDNQENNNNEDEQPKLPTIIQMMIMPRPGMA